MNAETLSVIPFEKIPLVRGQVPDDLWSGDVRAVVFSTTQPRRGPINLLRSAMERDIPTIAVEESNQIVFNNGAVNNYIMPVDHLLVASEYERQGMVDAGIPEERVEVTGWPFYAGRVGKTEPDRKREMKARFGLDPDRPVVTLGLTALHDAGESPAVRQRQLRLAAEGLSPEVQLAIKPHPIEKMDVLMPFIQTCAPHAHAIDGMERIDDVLEATDVLLNRGRSQVSFEALIREIPVIILDCGGPTPFHGLIQDLIVEEPEGLARAMQRISNAPEPMRLYAPVMEAHIPHDPAKARQLTSQRIAEIASKRAPALNRSRQWFGLAIYQAWKGLHQDAIQSLSRCSSTSSDLPVEALIHLIRCQATRAQLEHLKESIGDGFLVHVLRCLWIDQLSRSRDLPDEKDLAWLKDFPPPTNTVWFVEHVGKWTDVLLRSGKIQAAKHLAQYLKQHYMHVLRVPPIVDAIGKYDAGITGRIGYLSSRTKRQVRAILRHVRLKFQS
jgi:CDP-glycerol glycerophosphotransferase (TagB/SpsB family)